MMLPRDRQEAILKDEIAKFPKFFGLRAFPGERFTISLGASFVEDDIQLYVFRVLDGDNNRVAFSRGTPEELRREVTSDPWPHGVGRVAPEVKR